MNILCVYAWAGAEFLLNPSLIIFNMVSTCMCHKESMLLWLKVKNESYLDLWWDHLMTWLHNMFSGDTYFPHTPQIKYDFLYDRYHICCQERWRSLAHRQAYTTFIMVALFLLPLATMLFLYTRIGIELWIRKRVGDSSVLSTMNHREISKISR